MATGVLPALRSLEWHLYAEANSKSWHQRHCPVWGSTTLHLVKRRKFAWRSRLEDQSWYFPPRECVRCQGSRGPEMAQRLGFEARDETAERKERMARQALGMRPRWAHGS